MLQYRTSESKISSTQDSNSDSDEYDSDIRDPGREVIEKNIRSRLQRIANYTKEELNKVLQRVDNTLNIYESSVKSSLVQHGMKLSDVTSVEHVADIKELEDLLNDNLAKQRYKQRLMIFIVGQSEQAVEKTKLLQQVGQFFNEQKQNFSGKEFNTYDDINEPPDEIDLALKSFDVKDCYKHVKVLGSRLNELHEEIIQYLILNAGTKQQTKGKKKITQMAKQAQEQLTNLQSKLEMANNEMLNKNNKIETLEKQIETIQNQIETDQEQQKKLEDKLNKYETEINSYKTKIHEFEENIDEYKNQIDDLTRTISNFEKLKKENVNDTQKTDLNQIEQIDTKISNNDEHQSMNISNNDMLISSDANEINQNINYNETEGILDLNSYFNTPDGIDLNNVTNENLPTGFKNLRHFAIIRIREILNEYETKELLTNEQIENLRKEFDQYKITNEEKEKSLIEQINNSNQSEKTSKFEEKEKLKIDLIDQETQTMNNEPIESKENFRRNSFQPNLVQHPNDDALSHQTSIKDRIAFQSLENSTVLIKQHPSMFSFNDKENLQNNETPLEENLQIDSSSHKDDLNNETIPIDQFKLPFFHLYELIYKFRYSIINLLEQNKFTLFAERLQMIKQLSSDDKNNITSEFIENSEIILKDIVKILQTCLTTLTSTVNQYQIKEKEVLQSSIPTMDTSFLDTQQSSIIEQKESTIVDLTTKNEQLTNAFNEINQKHNEELNQNQTLINNQQKQIQTLRLELIHLEKRLHKIETEGIVEPSILFTRLDVEQNNRTLERAVNKGKLSETTYSELNETMSNYVNLPTKQFIYLVKRYVQFRKTVEIEERSQNQLNDNNTKNMLEKIESLYEQRSNKISKSMSNLRQQRVDLAKTLTEKFDHIENESSIFLIRPIYSFQGRSAVQSFMINEKRRRDAYLNKNLTNTKHHPSRLSVKESLNENQQISPRSQSSTLSNDENEKQNFNIEKSFVASRIPSTEKDKSSSKQITINLTDITRLEEIDIQRTLMPVSQSSAPLMSVFIENGIDPCVPSLNLRSYVSLSRPGIGYTKYRKASEIITPVSRDRFSAVSGKSQTTNMRTPFNSSAGDLRRTSPPLPPIKHPVTSSISSLINDRERSGFASSLATNEDSTTN